MVIKKGSVDELMADEDDLNEDIEFLYGRVVANEVVHGFKGNVGTKGRSRMGIKPPFLGFGVLVEASDVASVVVDVLGDSTITIPEVRKQALPAYLGTVSLVPDLGSYRGNRRIEQRSVLVGKEACAMAREALVHKVREESQKEALSLEMQAA
jgi:hypothetical protein